MPPNPINISCFHKQSSNNSLSNFSSVEKFLPSLTHFMVSFVYLSFSSFTLLLICFPCPSLLWLHTTLSSLIQILSPLYQKLTSVSSFSNLIHPLLAIYMLLTRQSTSWKFKVYLESFPTSLPWLVLPELQKLDLFFSHDTYEFSKNDPQSTIHKSILNAPFPFPIGYPLRLDSGQSFTQLWVTFQLTHKSPALLIHLLTQLPELELQNMPIIPHPGLKLWVAPSCLGLDFKLRFRNRFPSDNLQ